MKRASKFLLITFLFAILSSCSNKIYYNTALNASIQEKKLNISKIQFYLSNKIVLKREVPLNNSELTNGEIKFEDGKKIEQIIIKKNTPGMCEYTNNGFLYMSFEEGNNKLLRFNPDKSGKYYTLFMSMDPGSLGEIQYDSTTYYIQSGSFNARLWVKKNENNIYEINNRVAKGKKISTK